MIQAIRGTNPKVDQALLRLGLALLAVFSCVKVWMSSAVLENRQAGQERQRLWQLRGRR